MQPPLPCTGQTPHPFYFKVQKPGRGWPNSAFAGGIAMAAAGVPLHAQARGHLLPSTISNTRTHVQVRETGPRKVRAKSPSKPGPDVSLYLKAGSQAGPAGTECVWQHAQFKTLPSWAGRRVRDHRAGFTGKKWRRNKPGDFGGPAARSPTKGPDRDMRGTRGTPAGGGTRGAQEKVGAGSAISSRMSSASHLVPRGQR